MSYLEKLKSAGVEVSVSGAGVEIGGHPTDQQRKWISDHEPELLAELSPAQAQAERLGILPKGSAQKIKYVCCLDCGFDRADAIRCKVGVQRMHHKHKIGLCLYYAENPQELTPDEDAAIRTWLDYIGETQDFEIAKVLARCKGSSEALDYFLKRAEEAWI